MVVRVEAVLMEDRALIERSPILRDVDTNSCHERVVHREHQTEPTEAHHLSDSYAFVQNVGADPGSGERSDVPGLVAGAS